MKRLVVFILLAVILGVALGEVARVMSLPWLVKPTPTAFNFLRASDPATFVPAAGYPQLVEFFAFW